MTKRCKLSVNPVFSRASSTRETDHGLPGLVVKKETDASSLVEVCFFDSHIRATNAPASHPLN